MLHSEQLYDVLLLLIRVFFRDKHEHPACTMTLIVGHSNRASNVNKAIEKLNENTKNKKII